MSGANKADRMPLGGLVRRKVIRDLALSGMTQQAIAQKYGVTPGAVTQFKQRNAEEIAAVAAAADDDYAGILIAEKANRLAAYQELYELSLKPQPKIAPNGKIVRETVPDEDGNEVDAIVTEVDVRAAATMLKSAAEEMGQLVQRQSISGDMQTTTTYRIENVSNEDLT
jgi:hypothetical protein